MYGYVKNLKFIQIKSAQNTNITSQHEKRSIIIIKLLKVHPRLLSYGLNKRERSKTLVLGLF